MPGPCSASATRSGCSSWRGEAADARLVGAGDGGGGRGEQRDGGASRARSTPSPESQRGTTAPPTRKRIEDALRKHLGTDVRVTSRRRGRGFLTISYYSNDDLARLLELILGAPFQG